MFENGNLLSGESHGARKAAGRSNVRSRASEALRAIDWTELTARLNAARELRRELRDDAMLCAGTSGASFGDAAASYFKALCDNERDVNSDALGGLEAPFGIPVRHSGAAESGDARDD
jgi:hypothetical protein